MTNALILKGSYCDNLPPDYWWWEYVPEVVSAMSLDPQRVYPDREYPRWSAKIPAIHHGRQKQAQVWWEVLSIAGLYANVTVWLTPSPYGSKTKLAQPIGEFKLPVMPDGRNLELIPQLVVKCVERFLQKLQ